jgi:transglutaminase-like putative cysteine protease
VLREFGRDPRGFYRIPRAARAAPVTTARDLGTRGDGRYRVVAEDRVVANLVRNLWPFEAAADRDHATAEATRLLERWIAAGLPHAVDRGRRRFDPFEAVNFALQAWLDDGEPAFPDHQLASSRRMVREMRDRVAPAAPLIVTFRREFNLQGIAGGASVRLRLPLPITGEAVESIRIVPDDLVPAPVVTTAPGRLEVRFEMPQRPLPTMAIETTASVSSTATGISLTDDTPVLPWDADTREYRMYTRPDEGLIRVTPAVVQLANALAEPRAGPVRILTRIWEYFTMRMRIGFVHYDELDAADPLSTLIARTWCDCHTGAALFAALARARGIPARVVTGAVLYPVGPGQHSWLEVLLPPHGWLPVDILGAFLAARRSDDPEWRGRFFGHLDPRLTTQRLPDLFVGAVGVKVPAAWHVVQVLAHGGTELTLGCLDEREWVLRDTIRVTAGAGADAVASAPGRAG